MSKHTPGPWKIQEFKDDENKLMVIGDPGRGPSGVGQHVFTLNRQNSSWQGKANLNLIAAAPDLLRELENAISTIKNELPESKWDLYGVTQMCDAVEKARGES